MAEQPIPNPGSDEALAAGCTCPVIDNGRGLGIYGGEVRHPESDLPMFVFNSDCPLHGEGDWRDEEPVLRTKTGRVLSEAEIEALAAEAEAGFDVSKLRPRATRTRASEPPPARDQRDAADAPEPDAT